MKLNKKWIAVLLLLVVALALTACGEKKEDAAKPAEVPKATEAPKATLVGVWEMDKETLFDYTGITEEQYQEAMAEFGHIALTFEFTQDGIVTLTEVSGEEKQVFNQAPYTVEGDQLVIGSEGATYTLDGDKLAITNGEKVLKFNRSK